MRVLWRGSAHLRQLCFAISCLIFFAAPVYAPGQQVDRAPTGQIRVTIQPQGAIDAGARWRRTGTSSWFQSGDTETDVPVGLFSLEFKDVSGWGTPATQTITITNGQLTQASGNYTLPGAIHMTLSPQGAIDGGAQWRRVGTPN